jgi:hypothetical protein
LSMQSKIEADYNLYAAPVMAAREPNSQTGKHGARLSRQPTHGESNRRPKEDDEHAEEELRRRSAPARD